MPSLMDSVGSGLIGGNYYPGKEKAEEYVNAAKRLLNIGRPLMYKLPYDQSLFGKAYDAILRTLPPSLADGAKRMIDMEGYLGMLKARDFLRTQIGTYSAQVQGRMPEELKTLLGVKDEDQTTEDVHLEWEIDDEYADPSISEISGYKVKVAKGSFNLPSSTDAGSNKLAALDLNNSQKFKPREESLWYITLDRYEDPSSGCYSALPKIPVFKPKYADYSDDGLPISTGDVIDYLKWLPATNYSYSRRSLGTSLGAEYGWNHSFKQISGISRGTEFRINLEDDRDHSFSKYAYAVADRSACYETASVTYWECLLHKISIFILDKQWRVVEKYTLLGLLMSDGSVNYSAESSGSITYEFQIVGELSGKPFKKIESLEDNNES